MSAPTGLGLWTAYQPTDILARLRTVGARWVAPRAGYDGWTDAHCRVADLLAYKRAGLAIYPWIYPSMHGWHLALAGLQQLWDTGLCDGLIVDWEAEWCGPDSAANNMQARAFVAGLLAIDSPADGHPWIAHAPMDYRSNHPTAPWAAFDALDCAMIQLYAYEHDDRGHLYHLGRVLPQWADTGKPCWPIGCTYRPRSRLVGGVPTVLPPMTPAVIAADVAAFLDAPALAGLPVSLYSIEAASPEVMAMLADRAAPQPTAPSTPDPTIPLDAPAHALGVADRAEQEAADDTARG